MSGGQSTLLDYLSRPNPTVEAAYSSRSTISTKHDAYPTPSDIRHSEWFDKDILNSIFDGKLKEELDRAFEYKPHGSESEHKVHEIHNEGSVRHVAESAIFGRVDKALRKTRKALPAHEMNLVPGGNTALYFLEGTRFEPDYAATMPSLPRSQVGGRRAYNILPGDAKPSNKCCNDMVVKAINRNQFDNLWPFRQLLHYCLGAYSRYGYLLTDKEVFIVRILPDMSKQTPDIRSEDFAEWWEWFEDNSIMEYFTVPWSASGKDCAMTIRLALWTLHLLAANNGMLSWRQPLDLRSEQLIERGQVAHLHIKTGRQATQPTSYTDPRTNIAPESSSRTIGDAVGESQEQENQEQENQEQENQEQETQEQENQEQKTQGQETQQQENQEQESIIDSPQVQSSGLGSKRKRGMSIDKQVDESRISSMDPTVALSPDSHLTQIHQVAKTTASEESLPHRKRQRNS